MSHLRHYTALRKIEDLLIAWTWTEHERQIYDIISEALRLDGTDEEYYVPDRDEPGRIITCKYLAQCEYFGSCADDSQKSDYCPLRGKDE